MPQPIDLQTELMRVTAAERVQHATARAAQVTQQRSAAQQQHEQVAAESQVREATHAEEGQVDADGRPDPRKRRRARKGRPAEDAKVRTFYTADEKPEVVEDPEQHRLDISI